VSSHLWLGKSKSERSLVPSHESSWTRQVGGLVDARMGRYIEFRFVFRLQKVNVCSLITDLLADGRCRFRAWWMGRSVLVRGLG